MVSSRSPHNLSLKFCCVLSILTLIWLILMTLFCAVIRRDSVSLLKFPFLNHVQVFSCGMFISRLKHPYSCISSHFCFLSIVILLSIVLSVSFPMAVISSSSGFLYSPRVFASMHQHCLQWEQVPFRPPFLIRIVCQRRLWDVMPCAWSLVFLFFSPFV